MSLEHILLGELRSPATGYELGKKFADGAGHFWPAERSQIYPALKKLEKRGWLTCHEAPSARGPKRKVYGTTAAGDAELGRWLTEGPQIGRERLAYIAQVFYMGALDDFEVGRDMIEQMRARWRQTLSLFEYYEKSTLDEVGDVLTLDPQGFFSLAALRTGIHLIRAKVAWCDETIELLNRKIGAAEAATVGEAN
jgi:DNA-binding PadR family transcriptional regulator